MDNATCKTCSQLFYHPWVHKYPGLFPDTSYQCDPCLDQQKLQDEKKEADWCKLKNLTKEFEVQKRKTPDIQFYDWYKKLVTPHPLDKEETDQEYAFTFTSSPSLGLPAEKFISACELLCRIGMTAKYERIVRCAYVIEYHESGHPHLHGVYSTGGPRRITTKSFQRAWKQWKPFKNQNANLGFPGGYHSAVKHGQSYADYILKGDGLGNQGKVYTYEIAKSTAPEKLILS